MPLFITGGVVAAVALVALLLSLGETRKQPSAPAQKSSENVPQRQDAAQLVNDAVAAEAAGRFDEALGLYRQALPLSDDKERVKSAVERVQQARREEQLEDRYRESTREAQRLADEEQWQQAAAAYKEAVQVADEMADPPLGYARVQARIAEMEAAAEGESQRREALVTYRQKLEQANRLKQQQTWSEAIDVYRRALAAGEMLDPAPEGYRRIEAHISECIGRKQKGEGKPQKLPLEVGMTPAEVTDVLGKPRNRGGAGDVEVWNYGDGASLRFKEGKWDEWQVASSTEKKESPQVSPRRPSPVRMWSEGDAEKGDEISEDASKEALSQLPHPAKPDTAALRKGMTPQQVVDALGAPKQRMGAGKLKIWKYTDSTKLRFEGGKLASWEYPSAADLAEATKMREREQAYEEAYGRLEKAYRRARDEPLKDRWEEVKDLAERAIKTGYRDVSAARALLAQAEKYLGPGKEVALRLAGGVTMKLILIPAGEFMMGAKTGEKDARPVHRVRISRPFYMGVTEVTPKQWIAVMGSAPWSDTGHDDLPQDSPANYVSWDHARKFCRALCRKTELNVRLPTEAQWEYACRAGSQSTHYFGKETGELGAYAWYAENTRQMDEEYPHPVGKKKPNAWGLYDMYGNVWEWCRDWYDENYYKTSPEVDPTGPPGGDGAGRARGGLEARILELHVRKPPQILSYPRP
jgi:formylglycine-generating enzyme required for sulfatase activity